MPIMNEQTGPQIIADIKAMPSGAQITIGMLFVTHRKIIRELKRAVKRGVRVEVILDNNAMSFDMAKKGLPNAYIIDELGAAGIECYWFRSLENEYHTKFLYLRSAERFIINTGSANLTRRSLLGTNQEANIRFETNNANAKPVIEVEEYLEKLHTPQYIERVHRTDYKHLTRKFWVRIAEATGMAGW
jgi:phosphatidylserine/phosphatidylglycerophosphate/cardiolipin synthase-like enzyme